MRKARSGQQNEQEPHKIPHFVSDERGKYRTHKALSEQQIIKACIAIMSKKISRGDCLSSPDIVRAYFQAQLRHYEHEIFACLFLDNQHRVVLKLEQMFRGTINAASVYPREVVKRALELNAAAVIFAHNHPSGVAEPSFNDKKITEKLKQALALVDIRALDHFIVGDDVYSFAEHGLI